MPMKTNRTVDVLNTPHDNAPAGGEDETFSIELPGTPVKRIFSIRESDDVRELLLGMMDQTYQMFRHCPGVAEAMQLGLVPYEQPEEVDGAVRIRSQGHRAVAFVRAGTLFIIWGGSAASEDERGNNAYTKYLTRMIKHYRPTEVYTATFSRLVRNIALQGELRSALVEARTVVQCGGQEIPMGSEQGRLIWDVETIVQSMERDQIERRMVLGQVFAARRGLWGDRPAPFGYEVTETPEGLRLQLSSDPAVIDSARKMIQVLASRSTARAKLSALAQLGVTTHVNVHGGREARPIDQVAQPSSVLRTLHGYLEFYRHGRWTFRRAVPRFDGIEEIAGVPVQFDEEGIAFVEVHIDVETPDGGWADSNIFDLWAAECDRTHERSTGGGDHHARVKPLTGMGTWGDGDFEYRLLSDGRDAYVLRRRPHDPNRPRDGWDSHKAESEQVASFDSATLHQQLADNIEAALTDGHEIELRDAEIAVFDDGTAEILYVDEATRRAQLSDHLDTLRKRAERQAKLASGAGSDFLAETYHGQARQTATEVEAVTARLAQLDRNVQQAPPDTLVVHGRTVLDALHTLRQIETTTSREVAQAIRSVLSDLRWQLDGDAAHWSVNVNLATSQGLAILRGVSGELPRYCRIPRERALRHRDAAADLFVRSLAEGDWDHAIGTVDECVNVRVTQALLARGLDRAGMPYNVQRYATTHPVTDVTELLVGDALNQDVSSHHDPAWVELIRTAATRWGQRSVYNSARSAWAVRRETELTQLDPVTPRRFEELTAPARNGLLRVLGVRPTRGNALLPFDPRADSPQLAAVAPDGLLLPTCPCGSTDWLVIRLPEYSGLLCRSCWHANGIRFPSTYDGWRHRSGLAGSLQKRQSRPATLQFPAGEFTLKEWADTAGLYRRSVAWIRRRWIMDGLLEEAGLDPRHQGPGMRPMLYRLTAEGRRHVAAA